MYSSWVMAILTEIGAIFCRFVPLWGGDVVKGIPGWFTFAKSGADLQMA